MIPLTEYEARTGHRQTRHARCERPYCAICEGGLFLCMLCGGLEGALLERCPRRPLTADEHEANYKRNMEVKR
jgi:hypothetical protein